MTEDDFRAVYEQHVQKVADGDMKGALADMVPENLPAVFKGVTVPRAAVSRHEVRSVHADGDERVGEVVYHTDDGAIGVRSIWQWHGDRWLAARLENFPV